MIKLTHCKACKKELGRRQKMYCSNNCKLTDPDNIKLRTSTKDKQDETKLIKCKIDGKTFKDILNYSGVLTRHLIKLGVEFNNVFDHFEIVDNPKKDQPKYHCKYCDWATVDVKNKSGCITVHLNDIHKVIPTEHMKLYPDESSFWTYKHSDDLREYLLGDDSRKYIECQICHKKYKKLSTHLRVHDIEPDAYRAKYNVETLSCDFHISSSRDSYEINREKVNSHSFVSKAETQIKVFLEYHGVTVETSNRKVIYPHEVDLFLPEHNIAIEYNGLYYHSEFSGKKPKDYHIGKLDRCEKNNIRLIQIFEDEWMTSSEIVKSRLLHILGKSSSTDYARKCTVKNITKDEKNKFLNDNHIQGEDRSLINLGLFNSDNILVSVMTFTHLRKALGHKNVDVDIYELSRFATIGNIVGGASKLLEYFAKQYNPKKIISYADRRWTSGLKPTLYDKLGFVKTGYTQPNYWYTRSYHTRIHRYNFTKQKLIKDYGADPALTEIQNMVNMGFDRVWDCGSFKYEMNFLQE